MSWQAARKREISGQENIWVQWVYIRICAVVQYKMSSEISDTSSSPYPDRSGMSIADPQAPDLKVWLGMGFGMLQLNDLFFVRA